MAEVVNVTSTPGASYSWSTATFNWSSGTAAKTWATSTLSAFALSVASDLSFTEFGERIGIKCLKESFALTEGSSRSLVMQKHEVFSFLETYTDLIAYTIRFVESLTIGEKLVNANIKAVMDAFQVSEGLVCNIALQKYETLWIAETYTDLIAYFLRVAESFVFAEGVSKVSNKPFAESFLTGDAISKQQIKSISEAMGFAETFGRTVAFKRSLAEGFSFSESLKRAHSLKLGEAFSLTEQYRRHANGVVSDMLISTTEITAQDFLDIFEAGHPPGYTNFRDFIQGDYTYQKALFRAILTTNNADRGYLEKLRVTVDVPDLFDRGTASITNASSGVNVYFARQFRVPPAVTLTFKGGTVVAVPRILGSVSPTVFTVVLENTSGTRVTGLVSWVAQGY